MHALRDINKGEEITITYLGPLKNRKARQQALQERFGFTCLCRLCFLPLEQSQESDRRLEEIHRLDGVIDQLGIEGILVSHSGPSATLINRYVSITSKDERTLVLRRPLSMPLSSSSLIATWQEVVSSRRGRRLFGRRPLAVIARKLSSTGL